MRTLVNNWTAIGRLGKAPELTNLESGNQVVKFSLATGYKYKNKSGESVDVVDWHNCEAWGGLARTISKYCIKGSHVAVQGEHKTQKWTDKEGQNRYKSYFLISSAKFLDPKGTAPVADTSQQSPPQDALKPKEKEPSWLADTPEDDLPF